MFYFNMYKNCLLNKTETILQHLTVNKLKIIMHYFNMYKNCLLNKAETILQYHPLNKLKIIMFYFNVEIERLDVHFNIYVRV